MSHRVTALRLADIHQTETEATHTALIMATYCNGANARIGWRRRRDPCCTTLSPPESPQSPGDQRSVGTTR
jgi:hypothetical protein